MTSSARGGSLQPGPGSRDEETGLILGQRVRHATFGEGVVLECEGRGERARVQINFDDVGSKWLMLGMARLELLD